MFENGSLCKVSAPGRICLFGEHQDYLSLPVIPCAISLRIFIEGKRREDLTIKLDLPDIGRKEVFKITENIPYEEERDYFKSVVNVLSRNKYTFSSGFDCTVRGEVPINAGTSSSSALIVAWIHFLTQMSDQAVVLKPEEVARYAHQAEVMEFSEPGGMMDHYSTAVGNSIFLDFVPETSLSLINTDLKTFVLGNSGEPKDTKGILARVKNQVIDISKSLAINHPGFSLRNSSLADIKKYESELTSEQFELLEGTIQNYQITKEAKLLLDQPKLNHKKLGLLLTRHQQILRDVLRISTPKIDRMLDVALQAGAYGGKINGSGGGGCMFVYAPEDPEKVAKAIDKVGGNAYIINIAQGVRTEL